ncbi:unnamed protein product (mitochondrion) [Plasmodiophora brassicae]|uniref:Phosphofurin acidic cluster sorting protein 1/2 C-terminal domain-containing protein n=1 Tax=Plasmodiophora brassicae TaxID=37360 RepID=A0A3P3Y1I7_PLABS|nr:unnamed protein product [Plasmodiophora brassicae]
MTSMVSTRNPGMLSQKAMKTMGLSVQDLFDTFIGARGGMLSRHEYDIFFREITSTENNREAVLIMRLFIKTFVEISTDLGRKLPDYPLQSLLNSILFLGLFVDIRPDTLLKKVVMNWSSHIEAFRKDAYVAGYPEVVSILTAKLCEDKDALDGLVSNVHIMHSREVFKILTQEVVPTLHRQDFPSQSFPFVYTYLLQQCKEKNARLRVFDIVLAQLQAIRSQPSSMEQQHSLLALLHLLRSMLSYWRAPTGPFLQTAIDRVSPFFSWPTPYSLVARRVLLMLKQEMLAPGNTVLERFAAESRVPETSSVKLTQVQRSRPIFYVIDSVCSLSSNFAHLVGLYSADLYIDGENKVFASGLSTEVQALLLLNIIHSPSAPIDPNDVYKLTEEDVILLFGQTVNILQESLDISPEDAVSHRERNFALIRAQFTKIARSNEAKRIASDLSLPPVLAANLMPSLPEIAHLHWLVARDYMFPTPEVIQQLGCTPFPKTPLLDRVEKVLRLYEAFADSQDPVEVRVCIAGSDSIIHQVATAYVELMQRQSEPLKGIALRFFLVPFRNSILASYIARYDSWYNRQLYVPMVSRQFLVPTMSEEEPTFNELKPEEPLSPFGALLQSNVESYVREAEYSLQIKLFQIEGWRRVTVEEGAPDLIIPLVERAEIGRVATAMLFKNLGREGVMATLRDVKEVFRDKDFNYVPLELNLQMTRVDLAGQPCVDDVQRRQSMAAEESIPFDRISISNIPSADDPAFPPNPKDPWLEVFAKVSEHKAKLKNRYAFLIQEPLQHVNYMKLTTAREDQSFRVVVDGECFGPFKQVRIRKIEDREQRHMSLNIGTFFPIQP